MNASPLTSSVWPLSVRIAAPSGTDQSLTDWSTLALATILPSGLNATVVTALLWPGIVTSIFPSGIAQRVTVLLPAASTFPSGLQATDCTFPTTLRVASALPSDRDQTFTLLSSPPLASIVPSGENATDRTFEP